jgi:hypothetical protein
MRQYLIHIERTKNKEDLEDVLDKQVKVLKYLKKHNSLELDTNTFLLSTDENISTIKDSIRGFINSNYSLLTSTIQIEEFFCLRPNIKLWIDKNISDINPAKLSMDGC